jgi:hypothetical protein
MAELLVDGSWVNITSRVMVRDNSGNISITRGQSSEGQSPNPGTCSLTLNNRDGLFSPANPMSPYYGKIGRNTQIRVSVAKGDDKSYRFWGEVTAWPESWDTTDTDVWVSIEAAGILRRLNQGSTPLRGTMYRGLTSAATTPPVAYWPCEDGSSATSLASGIGGQAMRIVGSPSLAADSGFACSAPLPTMGGGQFIGQVPPYTVTGQTQVRFLMYLPTAPADGTQLVRAATAGGTVPFWSVVYTTGGGLALRGYDIDGTTQLVNSGPITFGIDGDRVRMSMELTQNGANIDWSLWAMGPDGAVNGLSNSFASETVGRVTAVTVAPGRTITDGVFGHISVQADVTSMADLVGPVTAFLGETASSRIGRLCAEEGVNFVSLGASTDKMGPQIPNTFMALLQECVDVDQGILFEREVAFGLAYFARSLLYDQGSHLTLSYPGNQLAAVPTPVPDDQTVRNDVTASRPNGSSARFTLETGALSIQPPPLGVGPYSDAPTLNVASDDDLAAHAAWRVHLGTVDEPRYPAISVNLAHPAMATIRLFALNVIFGFRLVVQSPPARLGGDISQIVIGIQETITHFEHRITFVCQPESPYRVGVVEDPILGLVDSDASSLAAGVSPVDGSLQVAVADGELWVTTAGKLTSNPDFEVDLSGWTPMGCAQSRVPTPDGAPFGGAWSMQLVPDGVSVIAASESAKVPVTAGATYFPHAWLLCNRDRAVDLRVNWYDGSGVFVSTSTISQAATANTWTEVTGPVTAPVGAAQGTARPALASTPPATDVLMVDVCYLANVPTSTAAEFPFGVTAGGEVMLVRAITGTTSPQTFTVLRAINGVTKSHPPGEQISLATPAIVAL